MKFKQVIHPEMVLNRRGDLQVRKMYKMMLPGITFMGSGQGFMFQSPWNGLDINTADSVALIHRYLIDKGQNYHVTKDFLQEISKVNKQLPINRLPNRFVGYISFAKETLRDETDWVQGAYVYVGPASETSFGDPKTNLEIKNTNQQVLWIAYFTDTPDPSNLGVATLRVPLDNKKLEDLIDCYRWEDHKLDIYEKEQDFVIERKAVRPQNTTVESREIIFRTLINLVLYIHQPDPDLKRINVLPPMLSNRKRQALSDKAEKGNGIFSACTLPLTFVNWAWKRPMTGHLVTGHFKWQACGIGLAERKLIWINSYERGEFEKGEPERLPLKG